MGGQKALLKFAVLSLRPSHILLLDEPTNHLDAEACEALAKGLSEFKGGIVAVTHDELLIYRLIHCNWSKSELLVCREGSVLHTKNFGADCLNALKKEVRGAEGVDVESSKACEHAPEAPSSITSSSKTVVTKGQLPPWLQRSSRATKKTEQAIDESRQPQAVLELTNCLDHTMGCGPPDTEQNPERDELPCVESVTLPVNVEALASPLKDAHIQHGRHSRFRKDLVNLNKAVTKRLEQEKCGGVDRSDLLEFVKNSSVARQLRQSKGEAFNEEQFILDVMSHASAKRVR